MAKFQELQSTFAQAKDAQAQYDLKNAVSINTRDAEQALAVAKEDLRVAKSRLKAAKTADSANYREVEARVTTAEDLAKEYVENPAKIVGNKSWANQYRAVLTNLQSRKAELARYFEEEEAQVAQAKFRLKLAEDVASYFDATVPATDETSSEA